MKTAKPNAMGVVKAPAEKKPEYKISLDFGNVQLEGKGDTMFAALSSIKKPVKIVSKTFLKAEKGGKKTEMMLLPARAKRLFYPLAQVYMAKQLEYLLK